jgi:GNAT superfamily N-acetyltransferase
MPVEDRIRMDVRLTELSQARKCTPGVEFREYEGERVPSDLAAESVPLYSEAFSYRDWNIDQVIARVLSPATCLWVFVARDATYGRLIGITSVHSTVEPRTVRLHWMAVETNWRRKGVGTALAQLACETAQKFGWEHIMLNTQLHRTGAVAMYSALGFTIVEGD